MFIVQQVTKSTMRIGNKGYKSKLPLLEFCETILLVL